MRKQVDGMRPECFTHVDPFEDTERHGFPRCVCHSRLHVSPTSIRSRILKEQTGAVRDTTIFVSPTSIRSRILKGQFHECTPSARHRFTHVDPFEDTESCHVCSHFLSSCDSFTHVDPFEDTERSSKKSSPKRAPHVSPTSIRSRILKVVSETLSFISSIPRFTHVDPFEDTESFLGPSLSVLLKRFTHVDPFEDTESWYKFRRHPCGVSFTHVDPFEDTESCC